MAAILKYGWENMKMEIIYRCEKRSDLNAKEIELIAIHNSYENGYNCTKGGSCYDKKMEQAKRKIRRKNRHSRYNHTIYIFTKWHEQLQIFVGTMYNFIHQYNLPRCGVSNIIKGKQPQTNGWRFLRAATEEDIQDKKSKDLSRKVKKELTARRKEKFWIDA
jgi:hypothetical protein